MAAVEQTDADQEAPEKKKKSGGGLMQTIILVLLLLVLALGGFIAWKLVTLKVSILTGSHAVVTATDQADKPGIFVGMDNITVNLADTDQSRFLRVKMKLEVKGKQAEKLVKINSAQIKDLVITILSSKTFDDVRTPQGKFALKEELAYRINQLIGGHPITDVYFTDFVAQ